MDTFFYELAKEENAFMHEVWDSPGKAYTTKLPLNLSTGKFSHRKAKENSTTKLTIKIIAGLKENKA